MRSRARGGAARGGDISNPFQSDFTIANTYPQLGAGRGGAVGKRSRMRPGLPDHFNMRLQRPLLGDDKAGTDITHVDVRIVPIVHCQFGDVMCACGGNSGVLTSVAATAYSHNCMSWLGSTMEAPACSSILLQQHSKVEPDI